LDWGYCQWRYLRCPCLHLTDITVNMSTSIVVTTGTGTEAMSDMVEDTVDNMEEEVSGEVPVEDTVAILEASQEDLVVPVEDLVVPVVDTVVILEALEEALVDPEDSVVELLVLLQMPVHSRSMLVDPAVV